MTGKREIVIIDLEEDPFSAQRERSEVMLVIRIVTGIKGGEGSHCRQYHLHERFAALVDACMLIVAEK